MVLSNISNFEGFEIHGGRSQKKVYDGMKDN
jgi:hypothetical protein